MKIQLFFSPPHHACIRFSDGLRLVLRSSCITDFIHRRREIITEKHFFFYERYYVLDDIRARDTISIKINLKNARSTVTRLSRTRIRQ